MKRLLSRQLKRSFGKDFDITNFSTELQDFISKIELSYEDFEKENKLLENILKVHSEELTLANQLIRNENIKKNKLIMDSQDSMLVMFNETNIVDANQKFFDFTGYKNLEDFFSQHRCICDLFIQKEGYVQNKTPGTEWLKTLLKEKNNIQKVLMQNKKTKQSIFQLRIKELEIEGSKLILATFSDITELEKIREKAVKSQNAKSDFLANMSHEIRTPLNSISGFVHLLYNTEINEKQKKYLDITQTSVDTLLNIINDILDFSKIESGHMQSELIKLNPHKEFPRYLQSFLPSARLKNISLQINIDNSLARCLKADAQHINQVMQNLVNNALKFTPQNGSVSVHIHKLTETPTSQHIRFSVSDTGIGIAQENIQAILEPFSQADPSTTRTFGGTGLGLSISNSFVNLMGGKLVIESEINTGSTFYFDLELHSCREHMDTQEVKVKHYVKQNKEYNLNILIAEDYDLNRMLIQEILNTYNGISFEFVTNGQEAVDILSKEHSFDIVFMDINMPILDGIQAKKLLDTKNINIPVIALTANALDGDREYFLSLGMDEYIAKPIDMQKLEAILDKYTKAPNNHLGKINIKKSILDTQSSLNFSDEILRKLLHTFRTNATILVEELKAAIKEKDYELILRTAHNTKSMSLTFNFNTIAEIAQEMETNAKEENDFDYTSSLNQINTYFKAIQEYIDTNYFKN